MLEHLKKKWEENRNLKAAVKAYEGILNQDPQPECLSEKGSREELLGVFIKEFIGMYEYIDVEARKYSVGQDAPQSGKRIKLFAAEEIVNLVCSAGGMVTKVSKPYDKNYPDPNPKEKMRSYAFNLGGILGGCLGVIEFCFASESFGYYILSGREYRLIIGDFEELVRYLKRKDEKIILSKISRRIKQIAKKEKLMDNQKKLIFNIARVFI